MDYKRFQQCYIYIYTRGQSAYCPGGALACIEIPWVISCSRNVTQQVQFTKPQGNKGLLLYYYFRLCTWINIPHIVAHACRCSVCAGNSLGDKQDIEPVYIYHAPQALPINCAHMQSGLWQMLLEYNKIYIIELWDGDHMYLQPAWKLQRNTLPDWDYDIITCLNWWMDRSSCMHFLLKKNCATDL